MLRIVLLAMVPCMISLLRAESTTTSLDGEWQFAIDPLNLGVHQAWFKPGLVNEKWDKVTVPHCYSVDPRYHYYTGTAWYFKTVTRPAMAEGDRAFLRFEAAFYHAQVWLNGKIVGEHEGGYTPFQFDVTDLLADKNVLVVKVNNGWDTTTIPGAKTKIAYQTLNYQQLYPWMNYGGITREVSLFTKPAVYLEKAKIDAVPDLTAKTASLKIRAFVRNESAQSWDGNTVAIAVSLQGQPVPLEKLKVTGQLVDAHAGAVLEIDAAIAPENVKLWSFDSPVLYDAEITVGQDKVKFTFGIRSITVQGTKLLLNGEQLSLGGCNRPLDAPGQGSLDRPELLEKDLRLIKSGGMELSRINHAAVSSHLLDWADRNGLLIIAEPGNWQMTPAQMTNPVMRKKFETQFREMIERDWNHPSVIAWSMGNEYQSQTKEGKEWTRDMCAFAKSLDSSRLVTFASKMPSTIKKAEDEASQYVDFICANIYGDHLKRLQWIHSIYPDKPIYVSEFGMRADESSGEKGQAAYFTQAMKAFRQCDFLVGASVWTFNDYESIFPGSNANGYRPWGLVAPDRTPRAAYAVWQKEFAPAILTTHPSPSGGLEVSVTARKDFPSYTLRNYKLKAGNETLDIPDLAPGESKTFTIKSGASVELVKPGGFVILKSAD